MTRNVAGEAPVQDDHALVERVKAGQTHLYGELVRRYQDRVFNTCWRICGHMEDARDLTQEAFLKAFESLDGYRHESGFYTWIFRVATNLALSHRRSAGRRRAALFDGRVDLKPKSDALHPGGDHATHSTDEDMAGRVAAMLQSLDEEHRAVVVLRDIEGFDYQQIAEILGLPPGTVKSRLHRARLALREAVLQSGKPIPKDT